jgi:hypothetical protein
MTEWTGVGFRGYLIADDVEITDEARPIWEAKLHVQKLLSAGEDVRIVTKEVADGLVDSTATFAAIESWCLANLGQKIPIQPLGTAGMKALYSPEVIQMIPNSGLRADRLRT